MAYVVTKLVTDGESRDVFLIGAFSDMKQAAAAATEEYKAYNKNASFVNLEMVNEWLATRGEYSFRRDKSHRLQLDISLAEENQVIMAERQKIFSCSGQDGMLVQMSSALVPDGVSKASL